MGQYEHRMAVAGMAAPCKDAERDADLVIAGVVVVPAVALIAIGVILYLVVVVRTVTWHLWYPLGQVVRLTGLDGFETWDWDGWFSALNALASSLVALGVVTLIVAGLLLFLCDLFGPLRFVPVRIIDKVLSCGRCSVSVMGFVIAAGLVWSALAVFLLLFPV